MRGRRILGLGLAVAAVALAAASTAYACVVIKGDGTVSGAAGSTNLLTGSASGHANYCPNRSPVTAAAGGVGSTVGFTFAPATACSASGNKLSAGTYDVRLRNTTAGYTGADGTGWTQVTSSGCFASGNVGAANNLDLGNLTVPSTSSGSGSWTIPTTDNNGNKLTKNGLTDASIFCVGKFGAGGAAPTGTSDGFLAPFRVTTV